MTDPNVSAVIDVAEHRREERFSCLKFPLLYSPANNSSVESMGDKIYKAAVVDMSLFGLAFDVDRPRVVGDGIILLIEKGEGNKDEEILAEVKWCREIEEGIFRIGLSIDAGLKSKKPSLIDFVGNSTTPMEVDALCPSCGTRSIFHFIAYQPILAGVGVMPLFNCSACGTTRSFMGVLG